MKLKRALVHVTGVSSLFAAAFFSYDLPDLNRTTLKIIERRTLQETIAAIPKDCGIPSELTSVILAQEVRGEKSETDKIAAVKYEPGHLEKYGKKISNNPEVAREYASSHGAFQIMGWHCKFNFDGSRADRCEWYQLHDIEISKREYCRIMNDCRAKNERADTAQSKYYGIFKCYNGSDKYASEALEQLKNISLNKL